MDIEFADKKLELIESDRAADTKLPIAVINSLRNKGGLKVQAQQGRFYLSSVV